MISVRFLTNEEERVHERLSTPMLSLSRAEVHILLALADQERHGYAIMQRINESPGSQIRIGPATLYRSIRRLLDEGLLEEVEERPDPELDDERRRYYKLTDIGRQVARAELTQLQRLIDTYARYLGCDQETHPTNYDTEQAITNADTSAHSSGTTESADPSLTASEGHPAQQSTMRKTLNDTASAPASAQESENPDAHRRHR